MNHLSDSLLNEYLDHRLPASTRRKVKAHLQSCDDCRARLGELQLVFNRLADLPEVRVPHDLAPDILARLPQKNTRLWTPVLAAQVGAVLGIIFWLSSQAVRLINLPAIPIFRFQQFTLSGVNTLFSPVNLYSMTIHFLSTLPKAQILTAFPVGGLPYPHIPFPANPFPAWHVPLSNISSSVIIISSLLLWLFGNAILLREPPRVKR